MDRGLEAAPERAPLVGFLTRVWGGRVHYHSVGEGRPVLLLHGNGSLGEEILAGFPPLPGIRWIAPDRPGYGLSEPLPPGHEGPLTLAAWIADFLAHCDAPRVVVAAHSIAAGAATCFAGAHPDRVDRLVLLAPFCRPTPHRWMLGLRLAVAPGIGRPVRAMVVPALVSRMRRRILERMVSPHPVPASLERFPLRHAARPQALLTTAAELRRFNEDMAVAGAHLTLRMPVTVLSGDRDETAPGRWHLPWLRARARRLRLLTAPGVGHLVHHVVPDRALAAVLDRRTAAPGNRSGQPVLAAGSHADGGPSHDP